jgi:hypothetical protein
MDKWWKAEKEKVRGSKREGGMVKVDREKIIGREKEKEAKGQRNGTVTVRTRIRSSQVGIHREGAGHRENCRKQVESRSRTRD